MENVIAFLFGLLVMAGVAGLFAWREWSSRWMDDDAREAWLRARAKRKARRELRERERREREQQDE